MEPDLGAELGAAASTDNTKQWYQYLNDPAIKAGLFSAGLALMQRSWGNPVANAFGAYGQANSNVTEKLTAEAREDEQRRQARAQAAAGLSLREREGEANRANAMEIAKLNADSRAEVAGIRTQAMLERATMTQGAKTPEEQRVFREAYKQAAAAIDKQNIANQLLGGQILDETAKAASAAQQAHQAVMAHRSQFGGAAIAGPGTSENSSTGSNPALSPQPGGPAAGTSGNSVKSQIQSLDQLTSQPGAVGTSVRHYLSSPNGRAQLKAKFPHLSREIDAWEATNTGSLE